MTGPTADTRTLQLAADQLTAYLSTSGLPARVELRCLTAAAELRRCGQLSLPEGLAAAPADLDQVLATLQQLSPDLRTTQPLLNAVAELNAAADALWAR
jgi:hypothetical protein